ALLRAEEADGRPAPAAGDRHLRLQLLGDPVEGRRGGQLLRFGRGRRLAPARDRQGGLLQHGRDRPVALVELARVKEVVGELMEPAEDYPRRYRVRESPDAAALEAIGAGEM